MTLRPILLVTGSRALCDTEAAEAWAIDVIESAICREGPLVGVVTGDARGPDAWAIESATMREQPWTRYDLDGLLTRCAGPRQPWALLGTRERTSPRRWPLVRNEAMVAAVAAAVASGRYTARALALRAPWARTNGTAHTIGLCRRAGIAAAEYVCPSECGPQSAMVRP